MMKEQIAIEKQKTKQIKEIYYSFAYTFDLEGVV